MPESRPPVQGPAFKAERERRQRDLQFLAVASKSDRCHQRNQSESRVHFSNRVNESSSLGTNRAPHQNHHQAQSEQPFRVQESFFHPLFHPMTIPSYATPVPPGFHPQKPSKLAWGRAFSARLRASHAASTGFSHRLRRTIHPAHCPKSQRTRMLQRNGALATSRSPHPRPQT